MTEQLLQHWLFALTAVPSMCTTLYVQLVATTEVKSPLKRRQFKNGMSFMEYETRLVLFRISFSFFNLAITNNLQV